MLKHFKKLFLQQAKSSVSKQNESEEDVIQDIESYYALFRNSTMGLYQTTPEGKILSVNPAIIKMLKFDSREDLLSRDLSQGSYVDENKREEFKRILEEKGEITDFESEWYTKDRDSIVVKEGARAVKNEKGEVIRYDGAVEDITARKKAETALLKAKLKAEESDRLKTAFLQNISHEIRTPMNAIIGFSSMLENPKLTKEKQKQFTSIIISSTSQLLSIVTDILTISSLETGQEKINIQKTCIQSLLKELYEIFKFECKKHRISLYTRHNLTKAQSKIYTDKTKLIQILSNLITNALKFTAEKGFVEFGCMRIENKLQFYVKDNGIGIKPEHKDFIFDRFKQAEMEMIKLHSGTGLGLSISKGFVELLGGKIWVESELGKGSTFYFTIPYQADFIK